jgi:acetyl esterase/lipase
LYIKNHAKELGINPDQIMVGGESAGGGLAAAISMLARDKGEVKIAFQMPLYPMIDNFDTESSKDNHAKVWNTRRNHQAWAVYLRRDAKKEVSPYAAPSRQTDYSNLPPAYTFVCTAEPFFCETLKYIDDLKAAGVEAKVDVYEGMYHAFDMSEPEHPTGKEAIKNFNEMFAYAKEHYFAKQE